MKGTSPWRHGDSVRQKQKQEKDSNTQMTRPTSGVKILKVFGLFLLPTEQMEQLTSALSHFLNQPTSPLSNNNRSKMMMIIMNLGHNQ